MNRTKENEELIHVVNKTTEKLKKFPGSDEAIARVYGNLNACILLDISRSLAVIADSLAEQKEEDA